MELPEGVKGVIFDLDGTLADFPIDYEAMRKELKGLAAERGLVSDFSPLVDEIRRIATTSGFLKRLLAVVDKHEVRSVSAAKPKNDVIKFYQACLKAGFRVAILTRNGRLMTEEFLRRFNLGMPAAICSRRRSGARARLRSLLVHHFRQLV